jgi:hypothetical protein
MWWAAQKSMITKLQFDFPFQVHVPPGETVEIFDRPYGKVIRRITASATVPYKMDVYETRGVWFKVYPKPGDKGMEMWVSCMP